MTVQLSNIGFAAALYVGVFGRAPDTAGIDYWTGKLDDGVSRTDIATFFAQSDEAIVKFPYLENPDNQDVSTFLDAFYLNAFNRLPDAEGKAYWSEQLANGHDVGSVMESMLVGAVGNDALALEHKIEVANAYENATQLANSFSFTASQSIIHDVTYTSASLHEGLEAVRDIAYPAGETVEVPVPGETVCVDVPGPTVYVPTEPAHVLSFDTDGTINVTGTKGYQGTEFNFGAGNNVDQHLIMMDHTSGIEFALGGNYRTGDQYAPHAIDANSVEFNAQAGHQMNGVGNADGDNVNRSASSFTFSVNAGVNSLGDISSTVFLLIDTDPTINTNYVELKLTHISDGMDVWVNTANGLPVISDDDGSNPSISQNSVNWGFGFLSSEINGVGPAGSGDIPAGIYNVALQERGADGVTIIGQIDATFHMDFAA